MAKKQIFLTEKQIEKIKEQLASLENTHKHVFFTENQVSELQQKIQKAREETDKNPTEGQKSAGNYKMGRVRILGYDIAIENPRGTIRSGKDRKGNKWQVRMKNDYGYFTHTLGYDGDAVDVFLGDNFDTYSIFAIDQKIDGKFDETKIMLGFRNAQEAKDAYMANYNEGWNGFWKITEVPHTVFQKWLYDGYQQRKPFFEYADIKKEKLNENVAYSEYDTYLERYDEAAVLQMLISGKNLWTPLIQPAMYQQALNEFTKFGRLEKFPIKYIYQWIGIILKNTAIISSITSLSGRVIGYPVEVMINAFFNTPEEFEQYKSGLEHKGTFSTEFGWMEDDKTEVDDEEAICQYFDDNGIFWLMTLPDGSNGWTDFGLRPLEEIVEKYNDSLPPEQILVIINRALDVTHEHGDLASAFIEGGAETLSQISNTGYVNENIDAAGELEKMLSETICNEINTSVGNKLGYLQEWQIEDIRKNTHNGVIKLYHNTSGINLGDILSTGELDTHQKHTEGHGHMLFFTVNPNAWEHECKISIEVPVEEFENINFRFVNDDSVVTENNIPIDKYNFKIEKVRYLDYDRIKEILTGDDMELKEYLLLKYFQEYDYMWWIKQWFLNNLGLKEEDLL